MGGRLILISAWFESLALSPCCIVFDNNSLELDSEVGRLIMISTWFESLALNPCCILFDNNLDSQNEETCHNVPTHHCQSSPVENVVHQCKKVGLSMSTYLNLCLILVDVKLMIIFILSQVSDGARKCEKVPVKKCSAVTSQQCRQVCA